MAYLYCGRCGLEIRVQVAYLEIANCPRCLARSATVTQLARSPHAIVPASGWGTRLAGHDTDRRDVGAPSTAGAVEAEERDP